MKAAKEAFWLIDQLIQQGVAQFCISPGSRNSPLILAAAEHPKAKTITHFDERGLGFYALGYGKGAQKPAAVIVTSGTAVGNLLPSVMEAYHSSTPMILITADRPAELRDCGANQACDQIKIFSSYLRWQVDAPPSQDEHYLRSIAAQGVFHSLTMPQGPIQINCQLREPFVSRDPSFREGKPILFSFPHLVAEPTKVEASRGIILLGETKSDITPVLKLAKRIQWPIFADILSNARAQPTEEQILHFDPILKQEKIDPEFILHFGSRLTSKKALEFPVDLHIGPSPHLQDPNRKVAQRVQSDIDSFCKTFEANSDPKWLKTWQNKDSQMQESLSQKFKTFPSFTESLLMKQLSRLIPPDFAIFLGNGMPIREADLFLFPHKVKAFFANRGLSGIDGNIATAAGLIEAIDSPLLAILGDQTCLHDLNSLPLLKKTSRPLILILSNNFGGGIFSHLPVSRSPHFEIHIAAHHTWNFKKAAEMFELPYQDTLEGLSFDRSMIIELTSSRSENHKFHHWFIQ